MKWFNSLSDSLKAAYITGACTLLAAIIGGLFLLVGKGPGPTLTPTPVSSTASPSHTLLTPAPTLTLVSSTPSPSYTLLTAAEAIKPVYQDQLTHQSNPSTMQEKWDTGTTNKSIDATCAFTPRGYAVSVSNGDPNVANPSFCQATQSYGDFLIEVTVKITNGEAGLLFRDQYPDKWGYYSFEIDPGKGQFKASINAHGTYEHLPSLDWTAFPSGIQRGSTYTLQVIAQGSTLYFYIDRIFVAKATNTTYRAGSIGFVCYNGQGSKIGQALFSNVSVRDLSKA